MEYQFSTERAFGPTNPRTLEFDSDEAALAHALKMKIPIHKLHNMSESPAKALIVHYEVVTP